MEASRRPRAERLTTDGPGGPLVKDKFGNATAGLRSIDLDVPVAAYNICYLGVVSDRFSAGFVYSTSYEVPFAPEQLKKLYPTPKDYLVRVNRQLDKLVNAGWYLQEDVEEIQTDAEAFARTLK